MKTNQRSRRARKREYLTPQEVQKLLLAARNGQRATLNHLQRLKDSASGTYTLYNEDRKVLKQWLAVREEIAPENDYVFISERRDVIHRAASLGN